MGKKTANYLQEEIQQNGIYKKVKLSEKQQEFFNLIINNKITIGTGVAGTSKTFSACYSALHLLKEDVVSKIILTKSIETIGSSLGFLKGTLDEKLEVYKECFISNFSEMVDEKHLAKLFESNKIIFKPVQYMRGVTFNNAVVIIDEIQSFDIKELMAIVTRMGKNCNMIFIGDIHQNDIDKKYVALNIFKEILTGIKNVGVFEFGRQDIVRDPILIEITDKYEKIKLDGRLIQNKKNT